MQIFEHSFNAPKELKRNITVRIALPDNYSKDETIPFMLFHDAQNFFDVWQAPETKTGTLTMLDNLFKEGLQPFALVGIDTWQDRTYLERFTDFSPWQSSSLFQYIPGWTDVAVSSAGGRGDIYADFIIQDIIPSIEKKYSIGGSAKMRGIGGSSMAAMASIYIGTKYNTIFSRFGFMSPALWCFKDEFTQYISTIEPFKKYDRIYMDIGRKETSDVTYKDFEKIYLEGADIIYQLLKEKSQNILYYIEEEGEHNMLSIRRRLPMMFRYLWE